LIEGSESLVIQLQSATNPVDPTVAVDTINNTATGTIFDNDSASVSIVPGATATAAEGGASGGVQVQLSLSSVGNGPEQLAVPVTANFSGNADYSTIPTNFGSGAITGAISSIGIVAVDDRIVESSVETFGAEPLHAFSSATVSASGTQSISIADNDS